MHYPLALMAALAGCGDDQSNLLNDVYAIPSDCYEANAVNGPLLPEGALEDAILLSNCELPGHGDEAAAFIDYEGFTTVVNGGSMRLELTWDAVDPGGEYTLVAALLSGRGDVEGVYLAPWSPGDNPDPTELFVSTRASGGDYTLKLGLAAGPVPSLDPDAPEDTLAELAVGDWLSLPLYVLAVQSGDVQINVNWDTVADVDLYVTDPQGATLYFARPTSRSGGELDLDSNAACLPGDSNENIYWPTDGAPEGTYTVGLAYWSDCGVPGATSWRVTLLIHEEVAGVYEGEFYPENAQVPWDGGSPDPQASRLQTIAEFSFPL